MRAVIKSSADAGCRYVEDWPERQLRPDEVRIEVRFASVCGTDAAMVDYTPVAEALGLKVPVVLGHEMAGTVIEVGGTIEGGPGVGAAVAVETHMGCGRCFFCRSGNAHNCESMDLLGISRDGAFAERVIVPARFCFLLPPEIGLETGALLEPAGSAMHAILRSDVDLAGASVLVTGAGPVGLVLADIARAKGARLVVISEPNPHRRAVAQARGIAAIAPEQDPMEAADSTARTRGGFDAGFECSGASQAFSTQVARVRSEGTVMAVGLIGRPVDLDITGTLIRRGIRLRGSFGRSIWQTWDQLSALVAAGRVDLAGLISHRLPLDALPQALELMREASGKVVLSPTLPPSDAGRASAPAAANAG